MRYFVKLSIDGAFPSGVDNSSTYEIPEGLHDAIMKELLIGVGFGEVREV